MEVKGSTKVLGLIGDPVEHTLSPLIHNTLAREGNTVYVPFHVRRMGLESAIRGAWELGIRGMNVTVPHKSAVIPFLTQVDPLAQAMGAVNTLVRDEQGFAGFNTDAEGFARELDHYGIDVKGKRCVLLGAGGAARAAAFALALRGAGEIMIFNRTPAGAMAVAEAVNAYTGLGTARGFALEDIGSCYDRDYIAIQCTSVGLFPRRDECPLPDGEFFDHALCGLDLIYRPSRTLFMKRLLKRGKKAYNGLRMLLYQAVAAYEMFTGEKVDSIRCELAAKRLMISGGMDAPTVLAGYMGSGKTCVSRALGKLTGMKVSDTDEEIEKRTDSTIASIFESRGEEAFRDMETDLLGELLLRDDLIISAGGGMVLREENRRMLRDMGARVIYLKTSPEVLYTRLKGDEKRPLLRQGDLMERIVSMLSERGPVYEDAADEVIVTDGLTPEEIAALIMGGLDTDKE